MRGTVLIVDDDEDVSGLVAEVLREERFAVTGLAAQPAATCDVARLEPDLVPEDCLHGLISKPFDLQVLIDMGGRAVEEPTTCFACR